MIFLTVFPWNSDISCCDGVTGYWFPITQTINRKCENAKEHCRTWVSVSQNSNQGNIQTLEVNIVILLTVFSWNSDISCCDGVTGYWFPSASKRQTIQDFLFTRKSPACSTGLLNTLFWLVLDKLSTWRSMLQLYCNSDNMEDLASSVYPALLWHWEGPVLHSVLCQRFPGSWSPTLLAWLWLPHTLAGPPMPAQQALARHTLHQWRWRRLTLFSRSWSWRQTLPRPEPEYMDRCYGCPTIN